MANKNKKNLFVKEIKENKWLIYPTVCIALLLIFNFMIDKESYWVEGVDCDQLERCIIFQEHCITEKINNTFLKMSWQTTQQLTLDQQKNKYLQECRH